MLAIARAMMLEPKIILLDEPTEGLMPRMVSQIREIIEVLHREGVAALKPYRIVLNCTHNEYYSERMMDATEDYLATGGRLLQLGANSHYWCVGFRDEEPWVMEVRKLEAGSRAWQARPGEQYLARASAAGCGAIGAGRRKSRSASASPPRAWTSRCHTAACRTATIAASPGCSTASRARFSAMPASLWAVPPASRSTATTLLSERRRTRESWPRPSLSPTIIR